MKNPYFLHLINRLPYFQSPTNDKTIRLSAEVLMKKTDRKNVGTFEAKHLDVFLKRRGVLKKELILFGVFYFFIFPL